jgi:hypothetical protein
MLARTAWQFDNEIAFNGHCDHVDAAKSHMERGEFAAALAELDAALALGESPNARWNRALTLLALGRYAEGWEDYESRWWVFVRGELARSTGARLRTVLPQWRGEALGGRRLVVIHEAGFGDTIMLLRLIPALRRREPDVALAMPRELERVAAQFAPLFDEESERDVHCFTFDLPRLLGTTPDTIPGGPYLAPDPQLQGEWRDRLSDHGRRKIGVTWSTIHTAPWRNIDLPVLRAWLDREYPGHVPVSLQNHDIDSARKNGVVAFEFFDFADVAACASMMDRVVSIDTAALHIAGAIGHHDVIALLPHVPCWRWRCGSPWYPQIKLSRLISAG